MKLQSVILFATFWALSNASVQPVEVNVYYESQCVSCTLFLNDQLWNTFTKLRDSDIWKLKLVPYGNAKQVKTPDGSYKFFVS